MGLFSKLKKAVKNSAKVLTNPKKMHEIKKDLFTPSKKLTLDNVFKKLDPALDAISPAHNVVQEYTTGSATTAGQSPYFQKIAPIIVDVFLPGVGSAAAAVDAASNKNYAGAVVYLGSAYAQGFGNFTSAAPNSTPAGYSASDLGSGLTVNSGGTGLTAFGDSASLGTGVKGNMFSGFEIGGVSSGISNSAIIGFDNTDLGKGLTGITYNEAKAINAPALTAGAVRSGLKYAKLGADLYAMRTADGQILTTYGANQKMTTPIYQTQAPAMIGMIPTVRANDLAAEAVAAEMAETNAKNAQLENLVKIGGIAVGLYFLFVR